MMHGLIYVHMGDIQWHVSTNLIALVPPDKTDFLRRYECKLVGV